MSIIYTVGHSYISADEFSGLLQNQGIEILVDVRSIPGSKRSPQFNRETMIDWLLMTNTAYLHLPGLGGRRYSKVQDRTGVNAGWRVESFRWYANYTLTEEYKAALQYLTLLAEKHTVAIMCGEPSPTRCHRQIISNSLVAQNHIVQHVMPNGTTVEHSLGLYGAAPQVNDDGTITYPAPVLEEATLALGG